MPNELYLVGNTDKFFGAKKNPLSLLEKLPIIFREQGSGTRLTMERFFSKHNLEVSSYLELTSNEAVKQAVIAGLGYSILPLIGIREELMSGTLQIIPVKHLPIRSMWQLIWPEKKVKSPAAQAFLAFVKAEKQSIISSRFNWYADFAVQHDSRFSTIGTKTI